MLLSLLLVLVVESSAPQAPQPAVSTVAAAIELVQQGQDDRALEVLQRIVAANPSDHNARLWIARIHDRAGRPDRAEAVYRSIVLEDPRNVDALFGAGLALLAQDRPEPAIEILERAEMLAPQNADVLSALGRAHAQSGRSSQSVGYFQQATTLAPTPDHRFALEDARRNRGHRIGIQTWGEDFGGGTPDTRGSELLASVRISDTFRVSARGGVQRKFGQKEYRAGGGGEWRWRPSTTIKGQALFGNDPLILARRDYLGQIDYSHHATTVSGSIRHFEFLGANVTAFSPALTLAGRGWRFGARYSMTTTETLAESGIRGNAARFSLARAFGRRVWLHGAYSRGVEDFDYFSSDRIGDFRGNTGSAAVEFVLPSATSIVGGYDYQRRENGVTMQRPFISLVQSF